MPGLCFRLLWTNANELSGLVFDSAGCRTGKSGNFAANIWQKKQAGICRLRRQTTSSLAKSLLYTEPLANFSADETKSLLVCCTRSCCCNGTVGDFIRRPNEGRASCTGSCTTHGKNHISPATVATVTTLPQRETGYLAAYVCGKSTSELLQTNQKVFFTRHRWRFFPQTKRRACCTRSCCHNGTFGDFIRRPNAGPLAQDPSAAHTTRGKNAHFSRNCYNTAALRDRIPGWIRVWKKHK